MNSLLDLVYLNRVEWSSSVREVFSTVIRERFAYIKDFSQKNNDEDRFQLRLNLDLAEKKVPYVALIPPDQDLSGPYGGMSFVLFPADENDKPALVAMVVGTNGLAPDEMILGRPGHSRKCTAISKWLSSRIKNGLAWTKHDPVRIDQKIPSIFHGSLAPWSNSLKKYGHVIYSLFAPPIERTAESDNVVIDALTAYIDLFFDERDIQRRTNVKESAEKLRDSWLSEVFPDLSDEEVVSLLQSRRFVIIEGPPGTGKTEMARRVLNDFYHGNGREIQFHPGTTYESFIGGLAPQIGGEMGFVFSPKAGHLMEAIKQAKERPEKRFLLLIDEINRADLSKILGEAIYLLEPGQSGRSIHLQYDYEGIGSRLSLPENLDVLGTMNSADRSIAILDIAVRRRFAFVQLWPQLEVVRKLSGPILYQAFQELVSLFIEHASDDTMPLLPGHAYFLGDDMSARTRLETDVAPLLHEYMSQGYLAGFANEIQAYLDWIMRRV